ncbi:nucleotide exchange factor GrpE [Candidatus Poribacteria bacterium]|nr:MAG: nucleotide exchange factor GrpE [Candidatus Poribacteria bacterium]
MNNDLDAKLKAILDSESNLDADNPDDVDVQSIDSDDTVDTDEEIPMDNLEVHQTNTLTEITQSLAVLLELFEKHISGNQNQVQMFDKMYTEMKDYKESFLLEVLHKPVIHNLIQLYDSFVSLESQLTNLIDENSDNTLSNELGQYSRNLQNFRFELEEVLYRIDVTPYKDSPDTLDRQLHKTRKVISTDDPNLDQKVAEVHKIGFYWREKVFRPEDVTIYRYVSSTADSENDNSGHSTDEQKGK